MEIDATKMKVICQKCGKTGTHNVTIPENESGWSWTKTTIGSSLAWDCWLCIDCANEEIESLSEPKADEEK